MYEILIRFPGTDIAHGSRFAQSLKEAIRAEAPDTPVEQRRDNKENQDFGATLGIILAGPAIVAIAKGIEQWLTRHHAVTIEVTTADGKVIAQNVTAKNAVEIIKAAMNTSQD
jgi:hypothetical protein